MIHETQTMVEQRHPNLLPLLCCFVHGKQLWMVMPYMAGGSLLSIMQSNFPEARARPQPCHSLHPKPVYVTEPVAALSGQPARACCGTGGRLRSCMVGHCWDSILPWVSQEAAGCGHARRAGVSTSPYPGFWGLRQGLEEELVATVGLGVLKALEYMHSRGRIHRDVKARPGPARPAPGRRRGLRRRSAGSGARGGTARMRGARGSIAILTALGGALSGWCVPKQGPVGCARQPGGQVASHAGLRVCS